jgi:hypothetical protein
MDGGSAENAGAVFDARATNRDQTTITGNRYPIHNKSVMAA